LSNLQHSSLLCRVPPPPSSSFHLPPSSSSFPLIPICSYALFVSPSFSGSSGSFRHHARDQVGRGPTGVGSRT
jgi:hypothetical protein